MNPAANPTVHQLTAAYFSNLGTIEVISAVVSIGVLAAIIVIIIKIGWFSLRVDRFRDVVLKTDLSKDLSRRSWKSIQDHFYRGTENDIKMAVIEADKLLEEALRHSGVRGITLGDRLKNIKPSQYPHLDDVWQAHRLRNQIVHEPTFKLKRDAAERALKIYEEVLGAFHLLP